MDAVRGEPEAAADEGCICAAQALPSHPPLDGAVHPWLAPHVLAWGRTGDEAVGASDGPVAAVGATFPSAHGICMHAAGLAGDPKRGVAGGMT